MPKCDWPSPCKEPAEQATFNPLLSYCFEHGVEVENRRELVARWTPQQVTDECVDARYEKSFDPYAPATASEAKRIMEQLKAGT